MLNVGFGNIVRYDKVVAIISADSAPSKRMIALAKEEGRSIDATCGRKTQSIIITESNHIVLSALLPETLLGRINSKGVKYDDELVKGDEDE